MTSSLFRDDYNLDALKRIRPRGHQFEMLITPRFNHHYAEQRFEPQTAALVRSVSRRKHLFIDVGANYGFYTILAGKQNPDLQIYALEPVHENMEILRRNLDLNGLTTVQCLQKAASDHMGVASFFKSEAADNSGFYAHPDAPPLAEIEVPVLTLSSLLDKHADSPVLIKIDTDGHEIPVLAGLENGISLTQDMTLIVEFNPVMQKQGGHDPRDLLALLRDMGFCSFLIHEHEPRLIPIDENSDWLSLIGSVKDPNLYCRPKSSTTSVCFLSHSHGLAGAERSLAELVGQLVEDHGTVCNVVIPGSGPLREKIEETGAGVIQAEYGWWCSPNVLSDLEIRKRLGDDLVRLLTDVLPEIQTVQPDLICTSSITIPYGAVLAAILDKPHIWHLHEYGGKNEGYQFYLPFDEVLKFIEDFSDFIFSATKSLHKKLLPNLAEADFDYLYPYIVTPDADDLYNSPAPSENPQPLKLIDLSTLTESKQQETDLRAVAELKKRGFQTTLLLKGPQDPKYVASLKSLGKSLGIASQVTFENYAENIWTELDAADVVLISAPAHAFGRIAAEGMLRAKPVVYPAATDISEYMEDGVTGLSYEAGDYMGMADQVERLIQDPSRRREIGRQACAKAKLLFTRSGFSDKFLQRTHLLRSSAPGKRPPLPQIMLGSALTGLQRMASVNLELASQVQARSEELISVAALVDARQKEIAILKPILDAREQELASIRPVLNARDGEIVEAKSALKRQHRQIAAIKSVLAARDEEIAAIKPILAARDEEIAAIKPILAARQGEIAAIKPILAARDEEIAAIKPVLAARQGEIAAIKPILAARDEEIAAIKPVLAAREEEIAHLYEFSDSQSDEIQQLKSRLKEIEDLCSRVQDSWLGRLAFWITKKT